MGDVLDVGASFACVAEFPESIDFSRNVKANDFLQNVLSLWVLELSNVEDVILDNDPLDLLCFD